MMKKAVYSLYFVFSIFNGFTGFNVRVLLDEQRSGSWKVCSSDGFVLSSPSNLGKKIRCKAKVLEIIFLNGYFYINGRRYLNSQLKIEPIKGNLYFNSRGYQGFFIIDRIRNSAYLINLLDIEDYIYSVLRFESWPGWPLEVNKALAVASRSYVIAKALETKKSKKNYHIKSTNIHQTYNGAHDLFDFREAVRQTEGLFMAYNKRPVMAMFDSCCGGIVPADMEGVDFKKAPYLARKKICEYCGSYKIFSWKAEYSVLDLETIFRTWNSKLGRLKNFKIVKRDKAGIAKKILIEGSGASFYLTGKQVYSLLKKIKSFYYNIEKNNKRFIIRGRGYGHHLGLCQWGSRKMFDKGFDYKRILLFYYPGVEFMRLVSK